MRVFVQGTFPLSKRTWATQVVEPSGNEPSGVEAVDMTTLIGLAKGKADLLKIDVEGAEKIILRPPCKWVESVSNVAIELHGRNCEEVFLEAMQNYELNLKRSGELTICTAIRKKSV